MFLKNKNIIFKIRKSKVTDYAALRFISSMESLSKGSHTKGATSRSIIAYDEFKDKICNE